MLHSSAQSQLHEIMNWVIQKNVWRAQYRPIVSWWLNVSVESHASSALVGVGGSHQPGWLRRTHTSSRQLQVRPCSTTASAPLKPRLLPPNRCLQVWMPAIVTANQWYINPLTDSKEYWWVPLARGLRPCQQHAAAAVQPV